MVRHRTQLLRPVVATAALVIFVAFAAHGHWVAGLFYAAVPVLYLVTLTGKAVAGAPLSSWVVLAVIWGGALAALVVAVRESVGDQPDHWQLAVALWAGFLVLSASGVLLTIGARRLMRAARP
jgi:hypothetical protein